MSEFTDYMANEKLRAAAREAEADEASAKRDEEVARECDALGISANEHEWITKRTSRERADMMEVVKTAKEWSFNEDHPAMHAPFAALLNDEDN